MKNLSQQIIDDVICNILNDQIGFFRVQQKVEALLNSFNPSGTYSWDHAYYGVTAALKLICDPESDLGLKLEGILIEKCNSEKEMPSWKLAQEIYEIWKVTIKNSACRYETTH